MVIQDKQLIQWMLIIAYIKNFMWIWIHWPVTVLNNFCRWTEIPSCYGTNGAEEVVCLIKKPWRKNKPNLALEVTIQISLAKKPSSIGLQKWNQRCHYHSIPKINSNFGPEDNFHLPMEKPSSSGNCSATNTPYWKSTPIFLLKWN